MVDIEESYKAANDAHAHYDKLSVVAVSAMIFTAGGAFTIANNIEKTGIDSIVFLSAIPMLLCLQVIYFRLATFAGIARSVAAEIEKTGDDSPRLSTVYLDSVSYKRFRRKKDMVYYSVFALNMLLTIGMLYSAIQLFNADLC